MPHSHLWYCILSLCCFLDSPPRTVLSDPALEPDEVCSFPGILTIKFYSLVSVSIQGYSLVITQPSARVLEPETLSGRVWGSLAVSRQQPACRQGLECTWTSVWVEDATASIQPILAVWAHCTGGFLLLFRSVAPLPQSLRKSFYGILFLHSLLYLSCLCRKCHFAGVKPIKNSWKTGFQVLYTLPSW